MGYVATFVTVMGDVATFVTLRAAGSPLREMLSPYGGPVHRVGPDRQEAARDRSISRRALRPQQFPPARNRTTDWARLPPKENGYSDAGAKEPR